MNQEEDEDRRVRELAGEIVKLIPERRKIKTDLLYFKYAPILVMLIRWYGVSQFYGNDMEITLWYEENEEPVWFFYFITYILYPISLQKVHYHYFVYLVSWSFVLTPLAISFGVSEEDSEKGSYADGHGIKEVGEDIDGADVCQSCR